MISTNYPRTFVTSELFGLRRILKRLLCGISWLTLLVTATSATGGGGGVTTITSGGGGNTFQPAQNWEPAGGIRGTPNTGVTVTTTPLRINPNFPKMPGTAASLPKGTTHLMVRSDADVRQIFTHFPCPWVEPWPGVVGVYRLEVNSQGAVAAVTILKSMGPRRDTRVMQTFVGWRAKPGPLRIVDISWQMG